MEELTGENNLQWMRTKRDYLRSIILRTPTDPTGLQPKGPRDLTEILARSFSITFERLWKLEEMSLDRKKTNIAPQLQKKKQTKNRGTRSRIYKDKSCLTTLITLHNIVNIVLLRPSFPWSSHMRALVVLKTTWKVKVVFQVFLLFFIYKRNTLLRTTVFTIWKTQDILACAVYVFVKKE